MVLQQSQSQAATHAPTALKEYTDRSIVERLEALQRQWQRDQDRDRFVRHLIVHNGNPSYALATSREIQEWFELCRQHNIYSACLYKSFNSDRWFKERLYPVHETTLRGSGMPRTVLEWNISRGGYYIMPA